MRPVQIGWEDEMYGVSMSSQYLQCSDDLPVLYVTVIVPELIDIPWDL